MEASFRAVKRDETSGVPLAGASYTLYQDGLPVAISTSDASGGLSFANLAPGAYRLVESKAPDGFQPDASQHVVLVDADGNVTIDGQDARNYTLYDAPLKTLTFQKTDAGTGLALPGAVFTLSNGATATADQNGLVDFGPLAPGSYTMTETTVPGGYLSNSRTYTVTVSTTGDITVNGAPIDGFSVPNQPYPNLTFQKTDADSGLALPGATFTLSNGDTAVSDAAGQVGFGPLAPGSYTMTETVAPAGYERITTAFQVVVADDGSVTVDGVPLASYTVPNAPERSPRPVINTITEGDIVVTGQGVPGASITVTLPDGSQVNTTVDENGLWTAQVPTGATLTAGQKVYAHQTVTGSAPSEDASFQVQARA